MVTLPAKSNISRSQYHRSKGKNEVSKRRAWSQPSMESVSIVIASGFPSTIYVARLMQWSTDVLRGAILLSTKCKNQPNFWNLLYLLSSVIYVCIHLSERPNCCGPHRNSTLSLPLRNRSRQSEREWQLNITFHNTATGLLKVFVNNSVTVYAISRYKSSVVHLCNIDIDICFSYLITTGNHCISFYFFISVSIFIAGRFRFVFFY